MMTDLREILLANYKNGNADKIKSRWFVLVLRPPTSRDIANFSFFPLSSLVFRCSGDSPGLFKERWEKLFEDWVGVKQEKFDPSRVSCVKPSFRRLS